MSEDKSGRYSSALGATITGLKDRFRKRERIPGLTDDDRLDGKRVMVTGASSGLGFATAVELARRGAEVIMACRSGIPEKGEEVKRLSGSDNVRMLSVDLLDFDTVEALCRVLVEADLKLDAVVSNAAMVPGRSRKSKHGLEEMFQVNYLSKFYLINSLLNKELLRKSEKSWPRIIFVSSESHRNPDGFDWEGFGKYIDYPMKDVITRYSYFKLLLTTFAVELSRRLNSNGEVEVPVRALCPGPVNTNIAREAPSWSKPILKVVFGLFFKSPENASEPVVYFTAKKVLEPVALDYLFLMSRAEIDQKAMNPEHGQRLWRMSEKLLEDIGYPLTASRAYDV